MSTQTASVETEEVEFIPNPVEELMENDYPVNGPVLDDFINLPPATEKPANVMKPKRIMRFVGDFLAAFFQWIDSKEAKKELAAYRKIVMQSVVKNYLVPFNYDEPQTVLFDAEGKMTHLFPQEKTYELHKAVYRNRISFANEIPKNAVQTVNHLEFQHQYPNVKSYY